MKPGESLFFVNSSEMETARKAIWKLGWKPLMRKVEGGWRIWRTR